MIAVTYVLILIYSPFQISVEQKPSQEQCATEAHGRIGEKLKVVFWEKEMMGPHPVVIAAICAQGEASNG